MKMINYIILILTGEEDNDLQKLVEDKIKDYGITLGLRVDPLREKPALLTPKGIFTGERGIKFYLDRFVICAI
jgi:hypothetical protein